MTVLNLKSFCDKKGISVAGAQNGLLLKRDGKSMTLLPKGKTQGEIESEITQFFFNKVKLSQVPDGDLSRQLCCERYIGNNYAQCRFCRVFCQFNTTLNSL